MRGPLLAALLAAGCGNGPPASAPVASASAPPPVAPAKRVERLLYRGVLPPGPWAGYYTGLLGIDLAKQHAWFTVQHPRDGSNFAVLDGPLSEGKPESVANAWASTGVLAKQSHGSYFRPLSGTLEEDLVRYANIVEATGPWSGRTRALLGGPRVAASPRHIAYQDDHDHIIVTERDGTKPRRLDPGLSAAYQPNFSPDGSRIAFSGCKDLGNPVPGRYFSCPYHPHVGTPAGGPPHGVASVLGLEPPRWSPDGAYLYVLHRDDGYLAEPRDRGGCLARVDGAPPHAVKTIFCTKAHVELQLSLAPDARSAVVEGRRGPLGAQVTDLFWLELPSGEQKAKVEMPEWTEFSTLGPGGRFATTGRNKVWFVDLTTGAKRSIPDPGIMSTVFADLWTAEGEALAMRKFVMGAFATIVAWDVRAIANGALER